MSAIGRGVSLHIERLVIDGAPLSAREAAQLGGALQQELALLLQQGGGAPSLPSGAVAALSARPAQLAGPFRPPTLGRQIARSVYAALTRQPVATR
jgi:hypothetical protein